MTARLRLISWKQDDRARRASTLRTLGYDVDDTPFQGPASVRELAADPPDAVVIDLDRTPSAGRDVGVALRVRKGTRHVPLVFAGGAPEKVAAVRAVLPDAACTDWSGIRPVLADAVAHPPADPSVPPSAMAGYAGAPLPKKLGVRPGSTVALLNAPEGFQDVLGGLPRGVAVRTTARGKPDVTVWFVRTRSELARRVSGMVRLAAGGGLWIAWPKKGSDAESDLTQNVVREAGLAAGMVDYKVCRIDDTWAALRFSARRR